MDLRCDWSRASDVITKITMIWPRGGVCVCVWVCVREAHEWAPSAAPAARLSCPLTSPNATLYYATQHLK